MKKTTQSAQITANTISEADQIKVLALPSYTVKEVQRYLKPGEGFERAAPVALDCLEARPEIAIALKIDVQAVKRDLALGIHLAKIEQTAQNIAKRAQENRLHVESGVYRVLLKVNRFVQNAEDPELVKEFSVLSGWVASTHGAGGAAQAAAATPPPAPVVAAGVKST